jgi:hypothetical protein
MPEWVKCKDKECDQKIKDHMWGRIKATGWFFQKDGSAYCPDHIPEWVPAWREQRDSR